MQRDGDVQELVLAAVLPDWPLPLSLAVNPLVDEVVGRHRTWLCEHSLADIDDPFDSLVQLDAVGVAAKAYPRADADILALTADWTAWFFHFDDCFDEGVLGTSETLARAAIEFVTSPHDRPVRGFPRRKGTSLRHLRSAVDNLRRRTSEVMSPTQFDIFNTHLDAYLTALVAEARNRESGTVLGVDEYCSLRRFTGPAQPLLDLVEQAEGLRLPNGFYRSEGFNLLLDGNADIASWINDIFSVGKEKRRGDQHNLVLVIERAEAISLTEAACRAVQRIREHLDLLGTAERTVLTGSDCVGSSEAARTATSSWVAGLRSFLHHSDWYIRHARYTEAGLE